MIESNTKNYNQIKYTKPYNRHNTREQKDSQQFSYTTTNHKPLPHEQNKIKQRYFKKKQKHNKHKQNKK